MFYTEDAKKRAPRMGWQPRGAPTRKMDTKIHQHCITSKEEKQDGKDDAIMTPRQKKMDHLQDHIEHRKEVII